MRVDIRHANFENNFFDNTISIAVIHHLDSKEKNMQNEMFGITKSGGDIYLCMGFRTT